ncbi:MAG: hypothetical protein IAG13_08530, partial [Deltaproteobacteria bacterium]|nr:hypothetical protein [Nannocystaceae bacterium]
RELGIDVVFDLPDPKAEPPELTAEFAATRALGITSYPTVILERSGQRITLPTSYDPETLVGSI